MLLHPVRDTSFFPFSMNEYFWSIFFHDFIILATTSPQGVTNLRIKSINKSGVPTTIKPTEQNSIGGISVGVKNTGA